jgi:hypothetical protein
MSSKIFPKKQSQTQIFQYLDGRGVWKSTLGDKVYELGEECEYNLKDPNLNDKDFCSK